MLTAEQQMVVDTVCSTSDNRIIAVNSIAGSGKTSTGEAVIRAYKPKNGFYTAFNKAIVEDSKRRFGSLIDAKTVHALAYKYVKPTESIEDLNYLTIKENISYEDKAIIIDALDDFFRSSSVDIYEYATTKTNNEKLQELIANYASMMLEGKIPPTFNYMLKCLHIMLLHQEIEIDFDLLILDECLTGESMIATSTGDRSIRSIYNDLTKGKEVLVKSFNQTTELYEFKKAINPLKSLNRDVVEIKTEGLNKLRCTPNHKVLTQRGYVQAQDIKIGKDYLLLDSPQNQKTKLILNKDQYQIVLGSYLGDGHLDKRSKFNTYRIKLTQGEKQLNYLRWKASCLQLEDTIHPIKSGYTGKSNVYQTAYSKTFVLPDSLFDLVIKDLNPLGLAIWFMDDGSKYKINSNNFTKEENEQLSSMLLERFGIKNKVIQEANNFFAVHIQDEKKLIEVISNYLHPDVYHKIYNKIPEHTVPILSNQYKCYGGNVVTSITDIGKQTVYDFEVEDNHNFLCSNSKYATKIIVHNCQDTTAVTLEIFKLINAKHKVMFGDKYQNIYSFMNTVNAFEELDDLNLLRLTKSFRCNPYIADLVDVYGKKYLEEDFVFVGNDDIKPENTFKVAYITRTNAMLIERMHNLLSEGQTFTLTRNVNEIFALPMALLNAANGKPVFDKKYKYLENEYKNFDQLRRNYRNFYEYINLIMEDSLLESVTKMLMNFANKRIDIYSLKNAVVKMQKERRENPNIVLTTAHAFKGLEMDSVFIEDDLNNSVNRTIQRMRELQPIVSAPEILDTRAFLSKEQKEDLNTYYVALSRARTAITNVGYL